ncbi:conserved hypothetical protein [metagenome]|uniref:Uncharacterized protein n=1 Tax=metagenome TaxID=256318 RepID=A0A2P2CAI1_9ZZZZ
MEPPHTPAIRSQQDLEQTWRRLMGPLGFSRHQLWVMLIEADHRPLPHLIEIPDARWPPDAREIEALGKFLAGLHRGVVGAEGRVAFLRSRPGRDGVLERDRAWARALYDACRAHHIPCEIVHLATDDRLLPLDDEDIVT